MHALATRRFMLAGCTSLVLVALASTAHARLRRAAAKIASSIGYDVPGIVAPIRQPSDNVCWATAATILYSWKRNASLDIAQVMDSVGGDYRSKFDADMGLSASEKPDFLTRMALRAEVPQSYTIPGWEALLRRNGPLWVTTAEGSGFSIHARVLTGIKGDGTAAGTSFKIVDPGDGAVHSETVETFLRKFEGVARQDLGTGGDLRPQIVHY